MAAANATIRSNFYHPEHLLARYNYSNASTYRCAACERVVTGAGYSCNDGACNFDIHEACFTDLPRYINMTDGTHGHRLTLTRLGARRRCNLCRETSDAGYFMYMCAPCNFDVHPRCTSLLQRGAQQQQQQEEAEAGGGGMAVLKVVFKVGTVTLRVVDAFTGGFGSTAIDALDAAIDNM